jgi:amino acid adenylation domain-containing protein
MIHKIDENILLSDSRFKAQKAYWLDRLSPDLATDLLIPTRKNDQSPFPQGSQKKKAIPVPFSKELSETMIKLGKDSDLAIYIILLAGVKSLIYWYSENRDIIVVSPVYQPDVSEETFNDYTFIRSEISDEMTFKELVLEVRQSVLEAYENQDYPMVKVLEEVSGVQAGDPQAAITRILCLLDSIHDEEVEGCGDSLRFIFRRQGNRIEGEVLFNPYCHEEHYIQQTADHLIKLLEDSIKNVNTKIIETYYLSKEEKRRLIDEFNDTLSEIPYPLDQILYELFARQVERIPDHIALVGQIPNSKSQIPNEITYKELNKRSSQLAYLLKEKGVKPDTIVGIMTRRRVEMIVAILGIIKAGGAYLPIDPDYPGERIKYMLTDSAAKILLTTENIAKTINFHKEIIYLDSPSPPASLNLSAGCLFNSQHSSFSTHHSCYLAYIIYTSGSTGRPKAVMVERANVINLVWGLKEEIYDRYSFPLRVALVAPYVFDASVQQIFAALLLGHGLFMVPEESAVHGGTLIEFYHIYKIDLSDGTPIHIKLLVENMRSKSNTPGELPIRVKHFLIGGEMLSMQMVQFFWECFKKNPPLITNVYGPAECCVDCTSYTISVESRALLPGVPIGKPLGNQQVFILDCRKRLQPVGIPGELSITGNSVGRGYLNNPEMTAQKFISAQASSPKQYEGTRGLVPLINRSHRSYRSYIYRTGDLARWLVDGNLECLGRIDSQVKIRGFRIELGEIENQLRNHNDITDAVVTVLESEDADINGYTGKNKSLAAYIVSEREFDVSELRQYLSGQLPYYMIPEYFARAETIPLTTNRKIDIKKLKQGGKPLGKGVQYAAPRNEIEKKLVEIFSQVLARKNPYHVSSPEAAIGINDNFFEIGGNSLSILRVNDKVKEVFKIDIPVIKMFRYPTIGTLAAYLHREKLGNREETLAEGAKPSRGKNRVNRQEVSGLAIAVIGMAGRFPGAANLDEFWNNLKEGIESIVFFADEELQAVGIDPGLIKHPDYIKAFGVLDNKEFFDASFFGYLPIEAETMDPQIRLFHEVVWEALENSGTNPGTYNGRIGLYAGATNSFEWEAANYMLRRHEELGYMEVSQLTDKDVLCCRISYKLNLRGPAVSVQTRCSTSLVAIHMACWSLQAGECDLALAGGVTLSPSKKAGHLFREGMIDSPDGHCRAFDVNANGAVGGEGAGVVVLKPLQSAAAQGDNILAIIKGSAINNDGIQKVGFTAPGVQGQADVIRAALDTAGIESESIGYIETHGTATALGDPIEIEALTLAFNSNKRNFIPVGSVKSNMGHLDAAAGVAGFIKVVMALNHKQIPPSLHFKAPNPNIDFANSPFYVNAALTGWHPRCDDEGNAYPLRAGVSSFGIGGTNAHLVLEQAPVIDHSSLVMGEKRKEKEYQLILLSAKTETALDRMTQNLVEYFQHHLLNHDNHENPINPGLALANTAYTLQVGRKAFAYRKIAVCSTLEEAVEILSTAGSEKVATHIVKQENPEVVFMFSGQGAQYVNMGRELYREEAVFREEMDRCFEILAGLVDYNLKEILYPGECKAQSAERKAKNRTLTSSSTDTLVKGSYALCTMRHAIDQTEIAQPLLFIFEYSLARLLMKWGIKPGVMIGHSIGEYVAACLSRVFSLEDALKLVVLRGNLMQQMPVGTMLSVSLPEEQLKPLLENRDLSLAAVNSSSVCVVSGPNDAVDEFEKQLVEKKYIHRRLHTSHAFHSTMMQPILEEFTAAVGKISLKPPQIPFISNVNGERITDQQATVPGYWATHIRQTVRFSDGISRLLRETDTPLLLVEVGPGKTLSTFVRQHSHKKDHHSVSNLVKHPSEQISDGEYLVKGLGQLWLYSKSILWDLYHQGQKHTRIPLPTYPFEGQPYWLETDISQMEAQQLKTSSRHELRKNPHLADWFYIPSWEFSMLPPVRGRKETGPQVSLVFADECGLAARLVKKLQKDNHLTVMVTPGHEFKRVKDEGYIYTLAPGDKEHYLELMEELFLMDLMPRQVIHCWNITPNPGEGLELEVNTVKEALIKGFYSLVYTAQALTRVAGMRENIRLLVLSNRLYEVVGGENILPVRAVLSGPCRIIPQEFPHIRCTHFDIEFPLSAPARENDLVEQLCAELNHQPGEPASVIAYRGKRRWVRTFKPITLETPGGDTPYLKKNGVYLITGAPGDYGTVGFILARFLARQVKARLVLVSRSQLPPRNQWRQWLTRDENDKSERTAGIGRKIRYIRQLEELGSEVLLLSADVSDKKQLSAAVAQTENHFGKINGVIHAAAVMGKELLAFMVDENQNHHYEKQFIPKIYGLVTLYRVFKDKPLDFCLLTSSLAAIMGPLVAYTAANCFMDAFAHWANRDRRDSSAPWISVNWDNWQPLATSEEQETPGNPVDAAELTMTPEQGVEAFHRILSWGQASQVITCTTDLGLRFKQLPVKPEHEKEIFPGRKTDISDWFYKPAWKKAPLPGPSLPLEKTGADLCHFHWLVFTGKHSLAAGLVEQLTIAGHTVVTVEMGTDFAREHSRGFTINPAQSDHYQRLFRELEESLLVPQKILHCWNLTDTSGQDAVDIGLHSLIYIARAIGNLGKTYPVQVAVVSSGMQPVTGSETLCPEKATLLAPVKIIPFEYADITCRSIDIDNQGADTIIDQLLWEFETDFTQQLMIAYRDNQRWEHYFEPVALKPLKGAYKRLKEKGVYLITGGLGGMGFAIARHLGKYFKAKLILTDTKDFPGREHWKSWPEQEDTDTRQKIQCILELEKQGAEMMVRQADVSDYDRMQAVFMEARQRFGVINGIIHTAGLIDYAGVMQRRTRQDTEELLAAKVKGTLVLDRIFHDQSLDFLVLFSSAGNILYGLKFGQVGYNAGHEFLDVYAHHKQKQGVFTVTIDWNDWLEVGMSARAAREFNKGTNETPQADEIFSISPGEGIVALKRILEHPYPQIAVSNHELNLLIERVNHPGENVTGLLEISTGTTASRVKRQRPELSVEYAAPGNQTERTLVRIWQDFFDIKTIGINDDFFELGGDSLKAMTIIDLIHNKLNVKISLAQFFKHPNIKGLSCCLEGAERHQYTTIPRVPLKDYYPLSSAQKRIYVIQQMQPEGIVFNESSVMEIQGDLDREKLADTFRQLIRRHESLRTSFQLKNEEPVQKIHHEVNFEIEFLDFKIDQVEVEVEVKVKDGYYEGTRGLAPLSKEPATRNSQPAAALISSFIRPFDLSQPPLLRVGLVKLEENHFIMIIDTHHIISDGSSMGIFIKEFMTIYAGEILPPLKITYKDYSEWQNSEAGQKIMTRQETFWLQQFQGPLPRLNLPIDYPRPAIQRFQGNTRRFEIDEEQSHALKKLALKEETSLFMVMFAIFNVLLWRLSQQEHIITGIPVAGRRYAELQQLIGMFVNTLALKVHIQPGETFKEFLARITQQALQAFENQDYQFEDLVNLVETQRQAGRNPIFDVMFELHNLADQHFSIPGLTIKPYESENPISRFDLTLKVFQLEKGLSFILTYSTALFKEETIDMLIKYFEKLVVEVPGARHKKLWEIEVLPQSEKAEALADLCDDLESD